MIESILGALLAVVIDHVGQMLAFAIICFGATVLWWCGKTFWELTESKSK